MANKSYQFRNANFTPAGTGISMVTVEAMFEYTKLALVAMGWTLHDTIAGVKGACLLTVGAQPAAGETVTIGTKVYTFRTTLTPTEGEVLRGANAAASLDNLKLAINRTDPGTNDGVNYKIAAANPDVEATTNTDTTQLVAARYTGIWANSYATTETLANGSWAGANLGATTAGTCDQVVYTSQGESGTEVPGYVYIAVLNSFLTFRTYQYWNAGTDTGTRLSTVTGAAYGGFNTTNLAATYECMIVGNKDFVFMHGNTATARTGTNGVAFGHIPNKFYTPFTQLNGAHTSSAGAKALTVDSTSGFMAGTYIQIVGSNYEGCDKLQISSIDSATQMTVAALPRNYADNSYIGMPASTFGMNSETNNTGYYQWQPCSHYNDSGTTVTAANHYDFVWLSPGASTSNNSVGDFSLKLFLLPVMFFVDAGEQVGWFDELVFKAAAATTGDVLIRNTDGSIPTGYTATSGTGTTLVDTGRSWTSDAHIGKYVVITAGTGNGQVRKITDNDATSLTVDTWYTNPDATSQYKIVDYAYRAISNAINNQYGAFQIIDCVVPS